MVDVLEPVALVSFVLEELAAELSSGLSVSSVFGDLFLSFDVVGLLQLALQVLAVLVEELSLFLELFVSSLLVRMLVVVVALLAMGPMGLVLVSVLLVAT